MVPRIIHSFIKVSLLVRNSSGALFWSVMAKNQEIDSADSKSLCVNKLIRDRNPEYK